MDDHLSWARVATILVRHVRSNLRATAFSGRLSSLAADGVYLPHRSPGLAGRSYRPRFTLTLLAQGGFVSVALSLRSPAVAVSNRPALRCPDFPHGFLGRAIISWSDNLIMTDIRPFIN